MSKKKASWFGTNSDFTLNDSANASKPVTRIKKAADSGLPAWDELNNDYDVFHEVDEFGVRQVVYKKKKIVIRDYDDDIENRPGIVYPEIVFYLISAYIRPEEVGRFACINKAAYACTLRESFWRNLYKRHCKNFNRLPPKLRLENSFKLYGLRQRVIRALHHTYGVFVHKIELQAMQDNMPHRLIGRRCINVWYNKGPIHWLVYFKFKKVSWDRPQVENGNLLEELGKIDANPEQDCQVLQVTCGNVDDIPPLLGMTLCTLTMLLMPGYRSHRLTLGFTSSGYSLTRRTLPEKTVVIDTVVTVFVLDWWNPRYPHFDNQLPAQMKNEEALPVLKTNFFNMRLED